MSKLHNMRLVEIPAFRAVSSGVNTLDALFGPDSAFSAWVGAHKGLFVAHPFEPSDFLWHENRDINTSVWALAIKDEVTEKDTAPYGIIHFPGGMFLVATCDESDEKDLEETISEMFAWIDRSGVFIRGGFPESGMCNMPNPQGRLDKAMGISQQQVFLPLQLIHMDAAEPRE